MTKAEKRLQKAIEKAKAKIARKRNSLVNSNNRIIQIECSTLPDEVIEISSEMELMIPSSFDIKSTYQDAIKVHDKSISFDGKDYDAVISKSTAPYTTTKKRRNSNYVLKSTVNATITKCSVNFECFMLLASLSTLSNDLQNFLLSFDMMYETDDSLPNQTSYNKVI